MISVCDGYYVPCAGVRLDQDQVVCTFCDFLERLEVQQRRRISKTSDNPRHHLRSKSWTQLMNKVALMKVQQTTNFWRDGLQKIECDDEW